MNEQTEECVYEIKAKVSQRLRLVYRIVDVIVPAVVFTAMILHIHRLFDAVWAAIVISAILLMGGYRSIQGMRVCNERLEITTYQADYEFPWSRVSIKKYPAFMGRIDINVRGKVWPFSLYFGRRRNREAVAAMESAMSVQKG